MSAVLSLGRAASKISPRMALRCLSSSSSRPPTIVVQTRSDMAKPRSSISTVPVIESEHQSDIPNVRALSRLNVFSPWRAMSDIDVESKQELAGRAPKTQQQEAEEARKKKNSGVASIPHTVVDEGGACTAEDQSQDKDHMSEGTWVDWVDTDASAGGDFCEGGVDGGDGG